MLSTSGFLQRAKMSRSFISEWYQSMTKEEARQLKQEKASLKEEAAQKDRRIEEFVHVCGPPSSGQKGRNDPSSTEALATAMRVEASSDVASRGSGSSRRAVNASQTHPMLIASLWRRPSPTGNPASSAIGRRKVLSAAIKRMSAPVIQEYGAQRRFCASAAKRRASTKHAAGSTP